MTSQKTFYSLDDSLFTVDGIEAPQLAAKRFRVAWSRSACPTISAPYRQSDLAQAFAKTSDDTDFEGSLSIFMSNIGFPKGPPKGLEIRFYSLWTADPLKTENHDYIEPQMVVMEKRAGEVWPKTIEGLSFREFVNNNTNDNDADRSRLYRIKMWTSEDKVFHGANIENILNLINGRNNHTLGYETQVTTDHVNQLKRALEDHRQRTETPGHRP
jgi:hypothetical protein